MHAIIEPQVTESRTGATSPCSCQRRSRRQPLRPCIGKSRGSNEGRLARALVRFAVSVALLSGLTPTAVSASTLPSDRIDGVSVASRHLDVDVLPDVTVKEGALVDGDGRVLWARDPDSRRPMASITKIMTAVVALEHSLAVRHGHRAA